MNAAELRDILDGVADGAEVHIYDSSWGVCNAFDEWCLVADSEGRQRLNLGTTASS